MVKQGFLKKENYDILLVDTSITGLLERMRGFVPQSIPKWLKPEGI